MTDRDGQTITWDVENRPISITDGQNTTTYVYDGDGDRILETEGGETILYVNGYYEKNITTSVITTYYYLGSRLIAQREGTDLTYLHQDHLTGTSMMTNSNGASQGTIKYYPYGETRTTAGTVDTDKLFTGQRLDNTGLYYYNARYYDPEIGRFISADSIAPEPANPQSLNRYSYCLNNPLKYVDPSGFVYVDNMGMNDNGEFWYCVYSDAERTNLIGIFTGADSLLEHYGSEINSIQNDLDAFDQQIFTEAAEKADYNIYSFFGDYFGISEVWKFR